MIYVRIDNKRDCCIVNSDGEILADAFTVENNLDDLGLLFQRLKSVASGNVSRARGHRPLQLQHPRFSPR